MRRKYWSLVAVAGIGLAASSVYAGHNEPPKAGSLKGAMVTSYQECSVPNDNTAASSIPLPACHPAVQSNATCAFDVKGSGKFSAAVKGSDVALAVSLAGLQAGCEGKILQQTTDLRITTDDCASGDAAGCTVVDLADFATPNATCIVTGGKCTLKSTVNTLLPGTFVAGKRAGLEIGRISMFDGSTRTFVSGLLIP